VIDRSQCPKTNHGTYNAYLYGCICPDAREATRLYVKRWRMGTQPPAVVSGIGAQRRLQALVRIGYDCRDLSRRIGRHHGLVSEIVRGAHARILAETHDRVVRLFDELSMTPGGSKRAVTLGEQRGYFPPLCWGEDIDDPAAEPQGVRLVAPNRRHYADTAEDHAFLRSQGMSDDAIAAHLGIKRDSLMQALRRAS